MDRRTFLKIAGMGSLAFAASCSPEKDKTLFSSVKAPADTVAGKATWYASTCRECPAGCGVLAKNREGRIVKLEGNPVHPVNKGRLCMRGQAALQGVYHPDRLKTPQIKKNGQWHPLSFPEAESILKAKYADVRQKGSHGAGMLTETVSEGMLHLFTMMMQELGAPPPLVFEPFAYESLKAANALTLGVDGLVSYRMQHADCLVSFGADFLETWLSPVEYAWKFKAMHAFRNHNKHLFFQVSPYQSLTGANADHWLACRPGSEAAVALGLIRDVLDKGKGNHLPASLRTYLVQVSSAYNKDRVAADSGIPTASLAQLAARLMAANRPLVLGGGTGASDTNGVQAQLAANLLNLILDSQLRLVDANKRHRVEQAAERREVIQFFDSLRHDKAELLLLNNVNPLYAVPTSKGIRETLENSDLFVVCFSNFMNETAAASDLVIPVHMPLESWDAFSGKTSVLSTQQPVMGRLTNAAHLGDVILRLGLDMDPPAKTYKDYLVTLLSRQHGIIDEFKWAQTFQRGGIFDPQTSDQTMRKPPEIEKIADIFNRPQVKPDPGLVFAAAPSIRFFDGRGADKPWLCEIPDPLTRVAWQTPAVMHPETAKPMGISQEDMITIETASGSVEAPVYLSELAAPGLVVMSIGQGHQSNGMNTAVSGINPLRLFASDTHFESGGTSLSANGVTIKRTGTTLKLACTAGSLTQHGRTFALSIDSAALADHAKPHKSGLTMGHFPLTLPLPEGYDPKRDVYPAHDHDTYRWGMVVDLDRCIGCNACAAACYAENNIGIVGVKRVLEGREMAWMSVERYHSERAMEKVTFLPMMCQHCDNAPCEAVCPVYAPHHSKEGLNNQIYNRCIGTRYCVQNCPYKVRRFNWYTWKWPEPMNLQLNPDVTVRSKGVMEKCSFCIQRIKSARNVAMNENRTIRDGEVVPACVQTCPTEALVFGNLMDKNSRVRRLVDDPRAYQALGYLNTKPAVIYLKKVVHTL